MSNKRQHGKRGETTEADAVPWLTDEQQWAWRRVVGLFMKLPAALDGDMQRSSDLTLFEYLVLSNLSEAEGRVLQMSELAALANSSLSRLSHVVGRLQKRGWVTREVCPHDGRSNQAVLTDAGMAKLVSAVPDHVHTVRELVIDALTDAQLRQLANAAAKVEGRINQRAADRPNLGRMRSHIRP